MVKYLVNLNQSKDERKQKYRTAIASGFHWSWAYRIRDFTWNKVHLICKTKSESR